MSAPNQTSTDAPHILDEIRSMELEHLERIVKEVKENRDWLADDQVKLFLHLDQIAANLHKLVCQDDGTVCPAPGLAPTGPGNVSSARFDDIEAHLRKLQQRKSAGIQVLVARIVGNVPAFMYDCVERLWIALGKLLLVAFLSCLIASMVHTWFSTESYYS